MYRSTGCKVIVEATSGSRQHSKKSRLPLASWYSGRYRPAVQRSQSQVSNRSTCWIPFSYPVASPTWEDAQLFDLSATQQISV